MRTINSAILFLALALYSCNYSKGKGVTEEIFWVHGVKTQCDVGPGKAECMIIYRNSFPTDEDREYFYSNIDGFTFERGVMQKIKVKIEKLDRGNLPVDTSSVKYTLVEVLKKRPDTMADLQGTWTLNRLNDQAIDIKIKAPTLKIDLNKKSISGSTGCNEYAANIVKLTIKKLSFGNISSTRKGCLEMNLEAEYGHALKKTVAYQVNGENLILHDTEGEQLAAFKKNNKSTADVRINDL